MNNTAAALCFFVVVTAGLGAQAPAAPPQAPKATCRRWTTRSVRIRSRNRACPKER